MFLERFNFLKGKQTEIGNRSKLMIDLVFSIECSLKAVLFFQSDEDEKRTYKKVKKHDLKYLLSLMTNTTPIQKTADIIVNNIEHYYIGSRYTLEANIRFRDDFGVLVETYYSTIANPTWLENLYECAYNLYTYAQSLGNNEIVIVNFKDTDVAHELYKTARIRALADIK